MPLVAVTYVHLLEFERTSLRTPGAGRWRPTRRLAGWSPLTAVTQQALCDPLCALRKSVENGSTIMRGIVKALNQRILCIRVVPI
jgi:hypothetical protein